MKQNCCNCGNFALAGGKPECGTTTPASAGVDPCGQCASRDETGRCCGWPNLGAQPSQYEDLLRLNLRIGTILSAEPNVRARKPMHILRIDFGPDIGIKTTSAQLTQNYPNPDVLVGRQIAAVLNLPVKLIAGIKSEVLLLAATNPGGSILLVTDKQTQNGLAVR
jgi:tRNA-binding protein